MDLYSRRILSWKLNDGMKSQLVIDVLHQAYGIRQPQYGCIFHSDRGSQYASEVFQKKVKDLQMRSSMGDVGCCYDNAVVERFFGSLKHEGLGSTRILNEQQLHDKIADYIRYYNMNRAHSANQGMSPFEYENSHYNVSCFA